MVQVLIRLTDLLRHILILLPPLVVTNILHMIVVKFNLLSSLAIPISNSLFGKNKTWRGIVFVPILNTILVLFSDFVFQLDLSNPAVLGFELGMTYILFELPNSFIKRRVGINSGDQHGKYYIIFSLVDKMDSAFGVVLVYYLLGYVDVEFALFLFIISSLTHIVLSQFLVILKIKKTF